MTIKGFFLYSFLQFLLLTLLKLWFFNNQIFSPGLQAIIFYIIVAVIAAALVRRMGVISYFEAFFILLVWIVGDLFLDLLITAHFTGLSVFTQAEFWIGYLVMILSVFTFHKKRHIAIRKQQHAHHHGHH